MRKRIFMVDQVDAKDKMEAIMKGGLCEFFQFPKGRISTGNAFVTEKLLGK